MTYNDFIEKNNESFQIHQMLKQRKSYNEIASCLGRRVSLVRVKHKTFSYEMYQCYLKYLISIGIQIKAKDIYDFYKNTDYVNAYLEKSYSQELNTFRDGNPPLFLEPTNNLPYRNLSKEQEKVIPKKIVEARNQQKKTYYNIAKGLKLTTEKTKWMYEIYYHKKIMIALKRLPHTDNFSLWKSLHNHSTSTYTRWNLIMKEYPDIVHDLIDQD